MTQDSSTGMIQVKTNGAASKTTKTIAKPFAFTNGFAPQGMYTGKAEHDACGVHALRRKAVGERKGCRNSLQRFFGGL